MFNQKLHYSYTDPSAFMAPYEIEDPNTAAATYAKYVWQEEALDDVNSCVSWRMWDHSLHVNRHCPLPSCSQEEKRRVLLQSWKSLPDCSNAEIMATIKDIYLKRSGKNNIHNALSPTLQTLKVSSSDRKVPEVLITFCHDFGKRLPRRLNWRN